MQFVDDFRTYLLSERSLSKNTADGYCRDINQFTDYISKPLTDVVQDDVSGFIVDRKNEGDITVSTNRKLSALKTFYKFMVRKGIMALNPAHLVEGGRKPKTLPKPVAIRDIDKMLAIIDNNRDKAMVHILYGSGVRREELGTIRRDAVNYDSEEITVIGKGNKERTVPIHPEALELIRKITKVEESEWVFPSRKGGHLKNRQVNEIIGQWAKKAGLKGVTPHKFRHSFGSHLFSNGADIKAIADMMGHVSTETTQGYAGVSNTRNRSEYQKYHPKAKGQVI